MLLATSNYTNTSRSVLNPHARSITPNLEMQSLSAKEKIQYIGKRSTAHRLNVNFVSQDLTYLGIPSSYICWAATAACIVNYCKGTSKTAVDVAKDYHGPADFNYSIVLSEMDDVLGQYSLTYTAKEQVPSERVVLENIDDGYPIASGWTYASGSKHFCTIYGTNPISGYHYVMDPDQGFLTAILGSSGYTYVSAVSGDTLTFYSAACHSW